MTRKRKREEKRGRGWKEKDDRLFALLVLFFPSIIIVAASNVGDVILRFVLQILPALWQLIVMKNFVDKYYMVDFDNGKRN